MSKYHAGRVDILYLVNDQIQDQIVRPGLGETPGQPQTNGYFGAAVATGMFNVHGVTELAVGIPLQRVGGHTGAGAVDELFEDTSWSQNTAGIVGVSEYQDEFGYAVVARSG